MSKFHQLSCSVFHHNAPVCVCVCVCVYVCECVCSRVTHQLSMHERAKDGTGDKEVGRNELALWTTYLKIAYTCGRAF